MRIFVIIILAFLRITCLSQTGRILIDHDKSYPPDSILTYKKGQLNGYSQIYYTDANDNRFLQTLNYKNGIPKGKSKLIDCDKGIVYIIDFNGKSKPDTIILKQRPVLFRRGVRLYYIGFGVNWGENKCTQELVKKYGLKGNISLGCTSTYKKTKKKFKHNLRTSLYLTRRNGINWQENYEQEYKKCGVETFW